MKLKKIMSVVAAATLAAALCVPAFAAEEATPGEAAQDAATDVMEAINEGNLDTAKESMKNMTQQLQDQSVTVSSWMSVSGVAYFDYLDENQDSSLAKDSFSEGDSTVWIRGTGTAGDLALSSLDIVPETNTITVSVDLNAGATASADGYAVTIQLPSSITATTLKVSMINEENNQPNDTIVAVDSVFDGINVHKSVSFWVPHFTTYQLTPISLEQPSQSNNNTVKDEHPEIAEAIANGTWGKDDNATSTSSTSAVTENPIKKTGTEMSVVLFAVTVLAAVAVGGVGVAVNKSRKGE